MDALELLTADHNRVRGLFSRFKEADEKDHDAEAAELAGKIVEELEVHTTIEEEIFYPAVHDESEEIGELVDEGLQEHHVAKTLIEELGSLDAGSDEWTAKMKVLIENVEHHAKEEEEEMFPKVRSASDADSRKALAERLEARKADLGAPTAADKEQLSTDELREKAAEHQIPGRSTLDREDLVPTVAPD
jgi:hemerythrin superfamily protein